MTNTMQRLLGTDIYIFKGRRVVIHGYASHPKEKHIKIDGGIFLSHLPQTIYVKFLTRPGRYTRT